MTPGHVRFELPTARLARFFSACYINVKAGHYKDSLWSNTDHKKRPTQVDRFALKATPWNNSCATPAMPGSRATTGTRQAQCRVRSSHLLAPPRPSPSCSRRPAQHAVSMRYGLLLAAQGSAIGMGILLPDDIRNISSMVTTPARMGAIKKPESVARLRFFSSMGKDATPISQDRVISHEHR